jgi:hypothetical protein
MTSSLGDLSTAASNFNKAYGMYNHSASSDGMGLFTSLEVGFMLNKWNAWGVLFDFGSFGGFKANASDQFGDSVAQTIQPEVVAFQVEYYRFFPLGRFRLCANGGGGIYNPLVNINFTQNGQVLDSGQMTGLGWGIFLGVGFEMAIGEEFSMSVFTRGRYATTTNIQGSFTDVYGSSQEGGLAISPQGLIEIDPTYSIGRRGYRYANIDFTGATLGISVSYHY